MNLVEISDAGTPECSSGLVTGVGARWTDMESRGRHHLDADLCSGSYVEAVKQSLEVAAAELDIGEAYGERLGSREWM